MTQLTWFLDSLITNSCNIIIQCYSQESESIKSKWNKTACLELAKSIYLSSRGRIYIHVLYKEQDCQIGRYFSILLDWCHWVMGISLVRISDSQIWLQVRSIWSSFKITLMIKGPLQTNYTRITSGGAQELLVLQSSSVYSNKYPPLRTTE